ncbi:DUF4252 domain-containing protein [Aquimarina sp. W85]|uniref:DUF4252 domain-containing protein n=1 Tax=Aquimarina rhodophyticola TaxID=3342246 RepID=UPI00366A72B5
MKILKTVFGVMVAVLLFGCQNSPSLQTYFVDHQEDSDFIGIDIPLSLLKSKDLELDAEGQETLNSIKKMNVLALPYKATNEKKYNSEKKTIQSILQSKDYQSLMRFGSNGATVELKYVGKDDVIDEVVVFANDQRKGLALVRILGNNIKPEKIAKLVKSFEKSDIDLKGLSNFSKFLN